MADSLRLSLRMLGRARRSVSIIELWKNLAKSLFCRSTWSVTETVFLLVVRRTAVLPLVGRVIRLRRREGGATVSDSGLNSILKGFIVLIAVKPELNSSISEAEYPIHSRNVLQLTAAWACTFSSAIIAQPNGYLAFSSSISIFTLAEPTSNSMGSVTRGHGGPYGPRMLSEARSGMNPSSGSRSLTSFASAPAIAVSHPLLPDSGATELPSTKSRAIWVRSS